MKKGIFITNSAAKPYDNGNPWAQQKPFNSYALDLPAGPGLMLFRKEFDTFPGRVARVTVRATALGVFDLFLNGHRVGTPTGEGRLYDELKPEWTDYRYRVFEFEYDITALCAHHAHNTLIAVVSPGWWGGRISFNMYQAEHGAFCGEIEVTGTDGQTALLPSAPGWQTAVGGRIRTADLWDGEYFDAREPDPSESPEAFDWQPAVAYEGYTGDIVPRVGDPLRVKSELTRRPLSAVLYDGTEENGTEYGIIHICDQHVGLGCEAMKLHAGQHLIMDLGQNMVGRPKLCIQGARAGTVIRGYVAEFLNDSGDPARGNDGPEGSMYLKNYRSALARFVYVAAGRGTESYEPTHTYYGFRYLELIADCDVDIRCVEGVVVGSSIPETGWIETDNAEVNQLFSNIVWGMRGNYFSNPTDCPQRDERLGWTGDTQVFCGAGSYLADTRRFMEKWLGDVRCSQMNLDGAVCDVIPAVLGGNNNAAWGDATILVPYRMWLMYRDEALLAEHYEAMEAYMHSLEANGFDGPNTAYGDWLNYEVTDKRYIAVCYYAYDAELMELFSNILSRYETKYVDRAAYYHLLHQKIVRHYRETYIKDGELTVPTQTGYLLALHFHLVDGDTAARFTELLREKIVGNNYTLSTGFVGTGILNQTLAEVGLNDLAYSLLLQIANPSWLYSVRQGATTVWERWNSYRKDTGFGDVGMNSFNHYAYGAVAEWMFASMAGIAPDPKLPGFAHFRLQPMPDTRTDDELPSGQSRITRVRAHYDASGRRIESAWETVNGTFTYQCTIPEGCSATVSFPLIHDGKTTTEAPEQLHVNQVAYRPEELHAQQVGSTLIFPLSAGHYTITL